MTSSPLTNKAPSDKIMMSMMDALGISSGGASEFMLRPRLFIPSYTTYTDPLTTNGETRSRLSPQEMISVLRKDGLPLSAVAEIAGVQRKTVYSWIDGGPIRFENQQRLEILYKLLITNKKTHLLYLYRYWNQKTKQGSSLKNLLTEKNIDMNRVKQALSELWPIAEKYQLDLRRSYPEANDEEAQKEVTSEWNATQTDGSDEW